MKIKLKSNLLACSLGLSLLTGSVMTVNQVEAAEPIEAGFYFNNPMGVGEFYDMSAWSELSGNAKFSLLQTYPKNQITIYLDSINRWAKLDKLETEGKTFFDGSAEFQSGDITGSYKNTAKPSDVIEFPINESFEVKSIE